MFRIEVGNKKESVFYAITLVCVLLLVMGVTRMYWTHHSTGDLLEEERQKTDLRKGDSRSDTISEKNMRRTKPTSPLTAYTSETRQYASFLFFGTLILALLLLFCLTLRYYSRREMREAEKKWNQACERFLTRVEAERLDSQESKVGEDSLWSRVLKSEAFIKME